MEHIENSEDEEATDVMNPQALPLIQQQGAQQPVGDQDQTGPDLEERQELGLWLDPQVPGPLHSVVDDGDGWSRIDSLDALKKRGNERGRREPGREEDDSAANAKLRKTVLALLGRSAGL